MADSEHSKGPRRGELVAVPRSRSLERSNELVDASSGRISALVPRNDRDQDQGICFVRFVPQPPFDRRLVFTDDDTKRAAAFRMMRQRLLDRGDARTILCTSANAGEGKTTLAANLALSFAELGKFRVLLVEANFRPSALGTLFGFDPPKGFRGQIVRHQKHPDDPWVIIQIGPPALYIMAAERNACPRCAAELPEDARFCGSCGQTVEGIAGSFLDGAGFTAAMQRFREAFDYIVIDAPSVLSGGDVNLIQDTADAVVMAVRKGHSDERSLRRAIAQIAPAPVVAVTMFEE